MEDYLKGTIMNKIRSCLDIKVTDIVIPKDEDIETKIAEFPKLLFIGYEGDNGIKVADLDYFINYGTYEQPVLENVEGLSIYNMGRESTIVSWEGNILTLTDNGLGSDMIVDIDELVIGSPVEEGTEDYIYVKSLHNLSKRLNKLTVEDFRRFEIGIFVYEDSNENKSNYYMSELRGEFDEDFTIKEAERTKSAYIQSPLKFEVTEDGKTNRIIYGSIMIKTYK
ncbi:MAG: hypothetical protein ACRC6B_12500 [Fusobacteriaceae bacterium]